jgi:hypothetical protein
MDHVHFGETKGYILSIRPLAIHVTDKPGERYSMHLYSVTGLL